MSAETAAAPDSGRSLMGSQYPRPIRPTDPYGVAHAMSHVPTGRRSLSVLISYIPIRGYHEPHRPETSLSDYGVGRNMGRPYYPMGGGLGAIRISAPQPLAFCYERYIGRVSLPNLLFGRITPIFHWAAHRYRRQAPPFPRRKYRLSNSDI